MSDDEVIRLVRQNHEALVSQPEWEHCRTRPASHELLSASEAELGFNLPPLLRRLYLEIANGVVLPALNRLAGVRNGLPLEDDEAIDRYRSWRHPPEGFKHWRWPEGLLPVSHWGCAAYSCIACTSPGAPVFSFEAPRYQPGVSLADILVLDSGSLQEWLASFFDA